MYVCWGGGRRITLTQDNVVTSEKPGRLVWIWIVQELSVYPGGLDYTKPVIYTVWRWIHSLAVYSVSPWFKRKNWSLCMTLSFPPFWALLYLICLSQKKYFVQISASSCSGQEFEETHDLPRQCKSKFRKTSLFLTQDVGGICELKIHFFFFHSEHNFRAQTSAVYRSCCRVYV